MTDTPTPKHTPDAITVSLTAPATVRTQTWKPDHDDGATFVEGHWEQGVERELTAGQHIFTLAPGQSISFTR